MNINKAKGESERKMKMTVLEHLNLYFGGEWKNMRDFAKDFKEENEGDEEQAVQSLLMFINALSRNSEEHELLGRKFDALVKATAKVDGQYATLHREWREQNKTIALLQEVLKFYANPLTHEEGDSNDYEPPIYHDNGEKARQALKA